MIDPTESSPESPGRLTLAKIRHGLRTPINHIIGYAEILKEEAADQLPASFIADLEKIHNSGYILMALINRHLGEDCLNAANLDLHAICHELRTPVNHIIGYSEMLSEQCDDLARPEFKPDLDKIASAAHTWLALMEKHLSGPISLFAESPRSKPAPAHSPFEWSGSEPPQEPAASTARGHLLLADDDAANRDLLLRRLERLGYRVTVCEDGIEALRLARSLRPDLVLLDMLMPGLAGEEVLVHLKADESLRHVPVIMISALDEVESIARCIELGAEDYLAKPYNPILLRSRIGAALEKKRLRDFEQIYLRQLEEERIRSERLLLNILPRPIAERLKNGESRVVNSFDEVTVMFADLVGFTTLSAQIPPARLVRMLDQIFSAFDELANLHGLEKIKTIGDAYMAAAGVPFPHADHAQAAARMALDMHETIAGFNAQSAGQLGLKMRIGICTGPLIAGIIGHNKFIYDLWGDTVNTASRMESHGLPGRTQVAASTYELLRDRFVFEARGSVEIKGKGPMATYFLCRPR